MYGNCYHKSEKNAWKVKAVAAFLLFFVSLPLRAQLFENREHEPNRVILAGDTAFFRHDYRAAIRLYESQQVADSFSVATLSMAQALFELGEYHRAIETLQGIEPSPGIDITTLYWLLSETHGRNITVMSYEDQLTRRDSADIKMFVRRAPEVVNGYLELFRLGITMVAIGDTLRGLDMLRESLRIVPAYGPAHLMLAKHDDRNRQYRNASIRYMLALLDRQTESASMRHLGIWLRNALGRAKISGSSGLPVSETAVWIEGYETLAELEGDLYLLWSREAENSAEVDSTGREFFTAIRANDLLRDLAATLYTRSGGKAENHLVSDSLKVRSARFSTWYDDYSRSTLESIQ